MSTMNSERWREVSPYLDEALEMPEEKRAKWLASIHDQDPELATLLQELLDEHRTLAREKFLEEKQPAMPLPGGLAGQTVGTYTLLSQIGQGGMGSVWLAERNDGRFERQVAVKFLNISLMGKWGEERFKREGSILGRLAHPNIAELIDAGVSSTGQPYLVLEYIQGEHIDQYCDQRRLNVKARVRLFLNVLVAVAHAHSNLIVHRDIKPPNILVRADGQAKLLDFGIAKLLEGEGQSGEALPLTIGGALTPEYAAPEQLLGKAITTATDVYALGVLLYLILTGRHPAGSGPYTPADLVKAILDVEPRRLSEIVVASKENDEPTRQEAAKRGTTPERLSRVLRGDLDTIVAKALKKKPIERYPSVTTLADDLRRYLRNEPIGARPDTIVYRTAKFLRRHRASVTLTALAAAATLAGVAGTLIQARSARIQRDFALTQVGRSQALSEFHEFLLSDAAPSGKPFTVNDLLGRAEHIVARERAANDPNRVKILISIGRQYLEQDQARNARRVLEEAYDLSRGLADRSVRAGASCVLAVSLARDEELPRAQKLFKEGLRELPGEPQFALDRVECLRSGSEVAQQSGDVRQGIALAQEAQRVLRESPFDSDVLEQDRWHDLANQYSLAGMDAEAVDAFERAAALLTSLGRDDTATAATLFEDWALELHQLGRPLDAEKLYRRAIEISRANDTEDTVSPMVLNNYARSLRELGRLSEAADYAERAYAKGQTIGHQLVINQSLLERARIYADQQKLSRATEMLTEVEPRLRRDLPPAHYAFASLASDKATVALAGGHVPEALKLADQAVSIDEAAIKTGGAGAFYLPPLLIRRSAIELEARMSDKAVADAERAVTLLQPGTKLGGNSSTLGRAYLALGRALQAQGKSEGALAAFRSAAENLESTVGTDHPDTRNARQLAGSGSGPLNQ
jgi:eukaryotic-like serine/threonine-protein kinase